MFCGTDFESKKQVPASVILVRRPEYNSRPKLTRLFSGLDSHGRCAQQPENFRLSGRVLTKARNPLNARLVPEPG